MTLWTVARLAPLSMGFSQEGRGLPWETWRGLPFPFPGDLPDPGNKPVFSTWQVDSWPLNHQGSPGEGREEGEEIINFYWEYGRTFLHLFLYFIFNSFQTWKIHKKYTNLLYTLTLDSPVLRVLQHLTDLPFSSALPLHNFPQTIKGWLYILCYFIYLHFSAYF